MDGLDDDERIRQGYFLTHKVKIVCSEFKNRNSKGSEFLLMWVNKNTKKLLQIRPIRLFDKGDTKIKFPIELLSKNPLLEPGY